jgi:hypothetical protein
VKVGAVVADLLLFSRIESVARKTGADLVRLDSPLGLPDDLDLVLVDWSLRGPGWADGLRRVTSRVVLFGPHTDLAAHAAARGAGLGPMWARSRLVGEFASLLGG